MYQTLVYRLREALAAHVRENYGVEISVVLEGPPKLEMGEASSPLCFELAKRLKKAPRIIAQEIAKNIGKIKGIDRVGSGRRGLPERVFRSSRILAESGNGHHGRRESSRAWPRHC